MSVLVCTSELKVPYDALTTWFISCIYKWFGCFFFLIGDIGLLEYKLKTVFEESLCQTYGSCLPLNAKYNHLPDVKLTVYFSTLSKLRTILDV